MAHHHGPLPHRNTRLTKKQLRKLHQTTRVRVELYENRETITLWVRFADARRSADRARAYTVMRTKWADDHPFAGAHRNDAI